MKNEMRGLQKKRDIWSRLVTPTGTLVTNRDQRSLFVLVARPGTKGLPLLFRLGDPGWETGTKVGSQPGQI